MTNRGLDRATSEDLHRKFGIFQWVLTEKNPNREETSFLIYNVGIV